MLSKETGRPSSSLTTILVQLQDFFKFPNLSVDNCGTATVCARYNAGSLPKTLLDGMLLVLAGISKS